MEGEVAADAIVPVQVIDQKLEKIKRRCGYCGRCKTVFRDWVGHCSRRPQCKEHRGTRNLNNDEMAVLLAEYAEEQVDPELATRRKIEKAQAHHIANWVPPPEVDLPYP